MESEENVMITISNDGDFTVNFIPEKHPGETSVRTVVTEIILYEVVKYISEAHKS